MNKNSFLYRGIRKIWHVFVALKQIIKLFAFMLKLPKNNKRILSLPSPAHGNIGDHLISKGEQLFFDKYFSEYQIDEISDDIFTKNSAFVLRLFKNRYSIICIMGGGFLGTLWPDAEYAVREILKIFYEKKIVIFPQTMFYEKESKEIIKAREIYSRCKDLTIFIRDESINWVKDCFINGLNIKLFSCPDIALSLNYSEHNYSTKGILFCTRKDKEKKISDTEIERVKKICESQGVKINYTDTFVGYRITPKSRNKECDMKLSEFQKSQLVITDRLHGMIMSAISGTPCIALNNLSGKVKGVWNLWLRDNFNYILFAESINEISEDTIQKLLMMGHQKYNPELFSKYWKIIANTIKANR